MYYISGMNLHYNLEQVNFSKKKCNPSKYQMFISVYMVIKYWHHPQCNHSNLSLNGWKDCMQYAEYEKSMFIQTVCLISKVFFTENLKKQFLKISNSQLPM